MPGQDPTTRAALGLLGLADGADRSAVTRAYRRLARETHPDVSEAPDADARFVALAAAYRQALAAAAAQAHSAPPQRSPTWSPVRVEAPSMSGNEYLLWVGDTTVARPRALVEPLLVAGPVRIEPIRGRRASRGTDGRGL